MTDNINDTWWKADELQGFEPNGDLSNNLYQDKQTNGFDKYNGFGFIVNGDLTLNVNQGDVTWSKIVVKDPMDHQSTPMSVLNPDQTQLVIMNMSFSALPGTGKPANFFLGDAKLEEVDDLVNPDIKTFILVEGSSTLYIVNPTNISFEDHTTGLTAAGASTCDLVAVEGIYLIGEMSVYTLDVLNPGGGVELGGGSINLWCNHAYFGLSYTESQKPKEKQKAKHFNVLVQDNNTYELKTNNWIIAGDKVTLTLDIDPELSSPDVTYKPTISILGINGSIPTRFMDDDYNIPKGLFNFNNSKGKFANAGEFIIDGLANTFSRDKLIKEQAFYINGRPAINRELNVTFQAGQGRVSLTDPREK